MNGAYTYRWQCLAEAIGTLILVLVGVGSVHVAVLTDLLPTIYHVAAVWAVGVTLAILASARFSGAHLNPAVTFMLTAFGKFPARKVPGYLAGQLAGAIIAGAVLYAASSGAIARFEQSHAIVRGGPGSELSAKMYGQYYPNPGVANIGNVSMTQAMLAEAGGTAVIGFVIFAVGGVRKSAILWRLAPGIIGCAVGAMIVVFAAYSQGGFNPARDFGPRLVAYFAGWGNVAIPGPRGGCLLVYVVSPIVGALAGGGAYKLLSRLAAPVSVAASGATVKDQ